MQSVQLFNRLSEGEKIELRMASPDRLSHLAFNDFNVDLSHLDDAQRVQVVEEAAAIAKLEFANTSSKMVFFGASRKYQ